MLIEGWPGVKGFLAIIADQFCLNRFACREPLLCSFSLCFLRPTSVTKVLLQHSNLDLDEVLGVILILEDRDEDKDDKERIFATSGGTLDDTLGEEACGMVVVDASGHPMKYGQLQIMENAPVSMCGWK